MQMCRPFFRPTVGLAILFTSMSLVVAGEPGASERLLVVETGELPVLITAPHGGTTLIPGVPARQVREGERTNLRRDELTNELAIATADELEKLVGKRPSLVVAEFSRQSLDANRPEEIAYQHGAAESFYEDYHSAVNEALQDIRDQWQHGLLLDLHAQWQRPQTIMRGTRDGQTVSGLLERRGWLALIGKNSLLGSLKEDDVSLFPPLGASEGQWTHAGSYSVVTYGRDGIDGLQLEIGNSLCDTPQNVQRLASLLAKGIERHLRAEGQLPEGVELVQTSLTAAEQEDNDDGASKPKKKGTSLNEAEQAFVDLLTNAVLVGRFSIDGIETKNGHMERYVINKVTKIRRDDWLVEAQVTYGKVDIAVPVPVKVHWAGDTPVISLTDLSIPGLGEGFTTRVLFYKDRYAGSWYHGKFGGHMWGKIEKGKSVEEDSSSTPDAE